MLSSGSTLGMTALQSQAQASYSSDRGLGGGGGGSIDEYANDPASGGFFQVADYKNRHEDLKQMLDSNKDHLKLEAMKRIIGMVAKGRDASDLFPAVVKNVVSKNIEVKKLVYVYLVRYAEEQQDLALLSISTFQRALKDPNQLIRASALRVLSSIRVSMIVPIVMLAIRDSASDMSPYVRKTAAHAIPKLYTLDAEQKDELVTVLEKLLSDRTTLVVGSAVMAFEEVCPERVDLIHKNYRKLCNLLVDVDEWGQVIIINMLTRYARTQFLNPNVDDDDVPMDEEDGVDRPFYDEDDSEAETCATMAEGSRRNSVPDRVSYSLDADHRLLLRQTKPLLQSRNAAVVLACCQLYHHVAPRMEVQLVAKAMIRLLRSHKEVQSVVLTCIASMSLQRKNIFEPYMKSFFVRTSDPTHIKLLKLEILTNLATESNISVILREFQTYISSSDKDFVAATIQAIGRCASSIKEVTETCLNGLVHLLSNRDEYVVAESVVVIKKLLQTQSSDHQEIISQMAKLLDFITVAAARSAIIWLIGEYNGRVPTIAPDVLRKVAKTFVDESNIVKLQALNLAVKLCLTNPEQTRLLCQYVLNLAKYDQNYDIRDRARFLRHFVFPENGKETILSRHAKRVFLAPKPAPVLESKHVGREQYQLGSLSHLLNKRANGYTSLPDFPAVVPDPTVRNIEPTVQEQNTRRAEPLLVQDEIKKSKRKSKAEAARSKERHAQGFYSESEKESSAYESDSSDEASSDGAEKTGTHVRQGGTNKVSTKNGEESASSSTSSAESSSESSSNEEESGSGTEDPSSSSSSSESGSEDDSTSSSMSQPEQPKKGSKTIDKEPRKVPEKSNLELLLDLDDIPQSQSVMTPSLGGFLTPLTTTPSSGAATQVELIGAKFVATTSEELLNKASCYGLGATYRFTRSPNLFSPKMVTIEIVFTNHNPATEIANVQVGQTVLPAGMQMKEFTTILGIPPKSSVTTTMGIDFNDSSQAVSFSITSSLGNGRASLKAPVGEFVRAVTMPEPLFKAERNKLRGMTEHTAKLPPKLAAEITAKIYEVANVGSVASNEGCVLHFAAHTMNSKSLVLVTCVIAEDNTQVTVNCEKMVVGSLLLNDIKNALQ